MRTVAAVYLGSLFVYTALFTVAYLDFDRPEIRALCPDFDPYVCTLVLQMLSQLLPVVTLSHLYLAPSYNRLGINIGWIAVVLALLATTYIYQQRLRAPGPCLDQIHRPLPQQLSGTAGIMLTVGFFITFAQGILAGIYAILAFHELRILLAAPAPPTPAAQRSGAER